MISISRSVKELDLDEGRKLSELNSSLTKDYALAIRSAGEYAVEVEEGNAADLRGKLQMLEMRAGRGNSIPEYAEVQSEFRAELRKFRDQSADKIARLRAQMASCSDAMQSIANSVSSSGDDLEKEVKAEIHLLETTAESDDLEKIHASIRDATAGLRKSYQQLRQTNQIAIAQMQDELRALHREMAEERRALLTDPASGAWIRQKIERRIEDLLRQGEVFWVALIRFNLGELERKHGPKLVQQMLKPLVKRLETTFGKDSTIGRWDGSTFAAIVETDPGLAQAMERVESQISGSYPILDQGVNHLPEIKVATAAVPRHRSTKSQDFYLQLGQVAGALNDAAR